MEDMKMTERAGEYANKGLDYGVECYLRAYEKVEKLNENEKIQQLKRRTG